MTTNVIEDKLATLFSCAAENDRLAIRTRHEELKRHYRGLASGYYEAAKELQRATDVRQFMPRRREWPESAESAKVYCTGDNERVMLTYLDRDGKILPEGPDECVAITVPFGIDPRIKISREDMEHWEATNAQ